MNITPRTDALKAVPMTRHDSDEFARQLERELNALLSSHERLRVALEALVDSADATADYENTGAMDVGIKKACDALAAIPAEFRGGK